MNVARVQHLSSYVQRLLKESQAEKLEQQRFDSLNQDSALRNRSGSEGTTSRYAPPGPTPTLTVSRPDYKIYTLV